MMQHELFPKEVTSNVPMITLTGSELLHIEQHMGLLACHEEEIAFRTSCGQLTVTGEGLYFCRYTSEEAVIAGTINGVCLAQEGRRR